MIRYRKVIPGANVVVFEVEGSIVSPLDMKVYSAGDRFAATRFIVSDATSPLTVTVEASGAVSASTGSVEIIESVQMGITTGVTAEIASEDFSGVTATINGEAFELSTPVPFDAPVYEGLSLPVDYEGVASLNLLDLPALDGRIMPSTLAVRIDGGEWGSEASEPASGSLVASSTGVLTFTAERGYEGPVEGFEFKVETEFGVEGISYLAIEVMEEPAVPLLPIEPVERPRWVLASFQNGVIQDDALPVSDDRITVDIFGDDQADVTISLAGLSDYDRTNWRQKFVVNSSMLALVDDNGTVPFAGYIAKRSPSLEDETVTFLARGMKSWLRTRYINNNLTSIPSTATTWDMKADPRTIVKALVSSAFTGPRNPKNVIYPPSKTGNYSVSYTLSELKPISDAIDEIGQDPTGAEVKFVPALDGNRILFNLVTGSPAYNDSGLADIVIDLNNPNMIATGFDQLEDGEEAYSSVWLESDFEGQDGETINLRRQDVSGSSLIREKKEKLDAVLTPSQINEQFNARIEDALKIRKNNTLSVWDDEMSFWASVGRRIQLVGSGRAAGMDDVVRVTGVTFSTSTRSVDLTLANIGRVYPRLPKRLEKDDLDNRLAWDRGIGSFSGGSGGGGEAPWNPGEGDVGEWDDSGMFGDEGMTGEPGQLTDPLFDTYTEVSVGVTPLTPLPGSIVQNEGNRLFGLTSSAIEIGVLPTGSLGWPNETLPKIEIVKSFMNNGSIAEWTSAGILSDSLIKQAGNKLPLQITEASINYPIYSRWARFGLFVINNRIYLQINSSATYRANNNSFYRNNLSMFSAPLGTDGSFGTWVEEPANPAGQFYTPASMARVGRYMMFGTGGNYSLNASIGSVQAEVGNYIFNPTALEKWVSYPACDFGTGVSLASIIRSHGGRIYATPAYWARRPSGAIPWGAIYMLTGAASGLYPPTSTWTEVVSDDSGLQGRDLTVIRGHLVRSTPTSSSNYKNEYWRIEADGSLSNSQEMSNQVIRQQSSEVWSVTSIYSGSDTGDRRRSLNISRPFSFGSFIYTISAYTLQYPTRWPHNTHRSIRMNGTTIHPLPKP